MKMSARASIIGLTASLSALSGPLLEFRVRQLDEDERKQFNELEAQLKEAKKKLDDWAKSKPDRSEENMEIYKAMNSVIQETEKKISRY